MNYKLVISLWFILAVSIVYWDVHRWECKEPVSVCHNAEIKVYHDRPMCTECKMYCEVVDEKK
jgi:hypothetical protein